MALSPLNLNHLANQPLTALTAVDDKEAFTVRLNSLTPVDGGTGGVTSYTTANTYTQRKEEEGEYNLIRQSSLLEQSPRGGGGESANLIRTASVLVPSHDGRCLDGGRRLWRRLSALIYWSGHRQIIDGAGATRFLEIEEMDHV